MSWTRYLFHDFFTAKELNRIDANAERRRRLASTERIGIRQRFTDTEDDVGRLALLVHALAEACVRKGVLTREEIAAMVAEVDLLDGAKDGKLDPAALRSDDRQSRPTGRPKDFLRDLESGQ